MLLYGATRGSADGLLAARGVLLATILGPSGYGAWALFRLATQYAAMADVGIEPGLEFRVSQTVRSRSAKPARETSTGDVPAEDGATDRAEAAWGGSALAFQLAVFGTVAVAAGLASQLVADPAVRAGLLAGGAGILCWQVLTYGLVHLRARGELRRFAALEVVAAGLQLLITGGFALRWGLSGAFAGFAVASLIAAVLVLRLVPRRPIFSRVGIGKLLAVGFPIQVSVALSIALATADRLVVAALGGITMLGYYAFAVAVAGLANSLAWVVRTVIFPDVYGRAQSAGPRRAVEEHVRDTILPFARLFPVLLGALALGIAPAIEVLLPQYAPAVAPARIFLLTGVTFGLVSLGALAVVATSRQRELPAYSVAALLLNLALTTAALRSGLGLVGVAAAALASQSVYAGGVLRLGAVEARLARPTAFVLRVLAPLVYCAAVTGALALLFPAGDAASVAAAAGLYLALMVPLAPGLVRTVGAATRTDRGVAARIGEAAYVRAPRAADTAIHIARRYAVPLIQARIPLRRLSGVTRDGEPGSMLVAGSGPVLEYLARRFFAGPAETEPLGSVGPPALRRRLERLGADHDLVIARVGRPLAALLFDGGYLRAPDSVDLWVEVPDPETALRRASRDARRFARSLLENGWSYSLSRDPADFERFYRDFYAPYASARHGDLAVVRPRWELRRVFGFGGVMWIERHGRALAGQLFEETGEALRYLSLGTRAGAAEPRTLGALQATKPFGIEHAYRTGHAWLDLGGSMPSLRDGGLNNKRLWGAVLRERSSSHRDLLVRWRAFDGRVARFLYDVPLVIRDGEALSAVTAVASATPAEPAAAYRLWRALGLPGLQTLYVVGSNGWLPDRIQRPAPAAVTLCEPGTPRDVLRAGRTAFAAAR